MEIQMGRRRINENSAPYVIAEIGANHNGDMELARTMIQSAKNCGCDAVKFQSWTPQSLIAREEYDRNQSYDDSPKKHFGSLKEMVTKYYLREEQHWELKKFCDELNIDFCSTPFSPKEAELLNDLGVPFFKVASMDINNLVLLEKLADYGKPIVLSTGMASLSEVEQAVETLEKKNVKDIALLHCVSIYPPDNKDIHLNNLIMLQQAFGYPVGFSDHTMGYSIPLAAVTLGACIIEKHFTTDKDLPGWDHMISADPVEMKVIVKESAVIKEAMGSFRRTVSEAEMEKRLKFRRSIVATKELQPGHKIQLEDLDFKRPGTGISPDKVHWVLGKELKRQVGEDDLLNWNDLG